MASTCITSTRVLSPSSRRFCGTVAVRSASRTELAFTGRRRASVVWAAASPIPLTWTPVPGGNTGNGASAAVPSPAVAVPVPAFLPPPQNYAKTVDNGAMKAKLSASKTFLSAIIAGWYISFGGLLMTAVGGASPALATAHPGLHKVLLGFFGLPFGLLLVTATNVELFTGNTASLTAALLEKRASLGQLLKNWTMSFSGNLVGSMLMLGLILSIDMQHTGAAATIAVAKTSLSFKVAFLRGILANWLVCMAIWQASASASYTSKIAGIWLTISTFVALGWEHSVANMFVIPLGIALGAPVTMEQFLLSNLLPVTLGNIVGGGFFVATAFSFLYGRLGGNNSSGR